MSHLRATPIELRWDSSMPIYASEAFLKSEADEYGWIGGVNTEGHLRCVLPFTVIRKPGFRMVRFRTSTIQMLDDLGIEEEKSFLNSVVNYFRSNGADLILPSGNAAIFRIYPDGAEAAAYGTVIKDLKQSEAALWGEIRATHRQNIRKAEASGVTIKRGLDYLDASYKLVAETMKRSRASFRTHEDFKNKILALGDNVEIFFAEHHGAAQGCMVSPFNKHASYSYYAGSSQKPVRGAMHLLHWEAMRHFRALDVGQFDFQGVRVNPQKGSKQEGIAEYKRGFGGRLMQGYLWKCSLRPLKSAAYSLAARLLMGGDLVDQERRRLAAH